MSDALVRFCVRDINWVRDDDITLLVNEQSGQTFVLKGLEAAIWDWLIMHFSYTKITDLLGASLEFSTVQAELYLNTILNQWVENGLLMIEKRTTHG